MYHISLTVLHSPILQAYKRQANSVKIAKITAFTIIVSSFILGAFILASSYLQAKASCDQVQALDSVLEKELMLETLQQVNKVSAICFNAQSYARRGEGKLVSVGVSFV